MLSVFADCEFTCNFFGMVLTTCWFLVAFIVYLGWFVCWIVLVLIWVGVCFVYVVCLSFEFLLGWLFVCLLFDYVLVAFGFYFFVIVLV